MDIIALGLDRVKIFENLFIAFEGKRKKRFWVSTESALSQKLLWRKGSPMKSKLRVLKVSSAALPCLKHSIEVF